MDVTKTRQDSTILVQFLQQQRESLAALLLPDDGRRRPAHARRAPVGVSAGSGCALPTPAQQLAEHDNLAGRMAGSEGEWEPTGSATSQWMPTSPHTDKVPPCQENVSPQNSMNLERKQDCIAPV